MQQFSSDLLKWYDVNRRVLPWRALPNQAANPYHVWLSEIMLQQTTVATVKSYFEKFTSRWPTVADLATAEEEDILAAWAGLGYYARARNLIKCAKIIHRDMGNHFPTTEAELRALPGIGDYTAAAIAAIAFGRRAVVVDSNIERIIARCFKVSEPLPKGKKAIKDACSRVTPNERAGDFAQAMMDLGSSICRPKSPECSTCPLSQQCEAYKANSMEQYPVKAPKKERPTRRAIAWFIIADDDVMVERRPGKGLLGGMLGLPSSDWIEQSLTDARKGKAPFNADWQPLHGVVKHTFTHFHLEVEIQTISLQKRPVTNNRWVPLSEVSDCGMPTVFAKMVKHALKS